MTDEAGPDRVVQDVRDRPAQVSLRVDHPGREPAAEQVTCALVPVVEALCVLAVEELDASREPRLRRIEDEVDVVAHQVEGVAVPAIALDGLGEQTEIREPVVVVAKDRGAVDAASSHVEVAVRELRTKDARHDLRD